MSYSSAIADLLAAPLTKFAPIACILLLGCSGTQQPTSAPSKNPATEEANAVPAANAVAQIHFDSPEKVFDTYTRAMQAGEWGKVYACFTPRAQDAEVFEFQFELGANSSEIQKRHEDPERVKELEKKGVDGLSEEQTRARLVGVLKDKEAFFIEVAGYLGDDYRRVSPIGPLREIKIDGARARALATHHTFSSSNDGPLIGYPNDAPIYFSKDKRGWLIDTPTADEEKNDFDLADLSPSRPVEAYYHCPKCNTIQGGIYGDKPFKEFSGAGRMKCSHDWQEIKRQQFKELATKLHKYRWSDESDDFWSRK